MNRTNSLRKVTGLGMLVVAAMLVAAAVAQPAQASRACIPGNNYLLQGGPAAHANLPGGEVWAGTIQGYVDGTGSGVALYCVDIGHSMCRNECYDPAADVASPEVVWILNNHYPRVPGQPSTVANASKRARAVQLAIWHFTDGLDISTGGTPADVFQAARAIVTASASAAVPKTPSSLVLSPAASTGVAGTLYTLTATLLDQNGDALAGRTVSFAVGGSNTVGGDAVTDAEGVATFAYVGANPGADQIEAHVDYTIPVGLRWEKDSCQRLIMGQEAGGRVTASGTRAWDGSVAVLQRSWGGIKSTYR